MTKQEISAALKKYVTASQLEEGKKTFAELMSAYPDAIDGWDVYHALKIQRGGVDIEKIEDIAERFLDFGPVKNLYVLFLKTRYIDTLDQHNFRNNEPWIEKITQLSEQKNFNSADADPYPCNYTRGVMKLLKFYRKPNLNIEKVSYWISKLDPEKLSREENRFTDAEGKERILAPPQEDYYSILSDLKLKERKFQQCIDICDHALQILDKFHYDNDIWFKRRKAISLIELGDQNAGFEILLKISKNRKGEKWFIFHEIAEVFMEKGENEKALEFFAKAVVLPRDEDKKINLYADTARCLFKMNRIDDARIMADFIAAVTVKENLKQKAEILKIFDYFKINLEDITNRKKTYFSSRNKVMELFGVEKQQDQRKNEKKERSINRPTNERNDSSPLLQGKVVKILHDNERGKDGFLLFDSKQHYFALTANFHLTSDVTVGTVVEFKILPAKEGKKEQLRISKIVK